MTNSCAQPLEDPWNALEIQLKDVSSRIATLVKDNKDVSSQIAALVVDEDVSSRLAADRAAEERTLVMKRDTGNRLIDSEQLSFVLLPHLTWNILPCQNCVRSCATPSALHGIWRWNVSLNTTVTVGSLTFFQWRTMLTQIVHIHLFSTCSLYDLALARIRTWPPAASLSPRSAK